MRTSLRPRTGYSLVEMLLALPLMVLVIGGTGALMFMFTETRKLSSGLLDRKLESLEASQKVLDLFQHTTSIAEISDHAIEFLTLDRDGDGTADNVRLEWSGQPGTPLTIATDNRTPVIMIDDVHEFTVAAETGTPADIQGLDSPGVVVAHHDNRPAGVFAERTISSGSRCAQYFEPDLPADATQWGIHQIRLQAGSDGDRNAMFSVKVVRAGDDGLPTDMVLEEALVNESDLDPESSWYAIEFVELQNLAPNDKLAIMVTHNTGPATSARLQFEQNATGMPASTHLVFSDDGGSTWTTPDATRDARFYVIGSHDGTPAMRYWVAGIRLRLQVGDNAQNNVWSSTELVNRPELVSGN